jgi:hypothetical protein
VFADKNKFRTICLLFLRGGRHKRKITDKISFDKLLTWAQVTCEVNIEKLLKINSHFSP